MNIQEVFLPELCYKKTLNPDGNGLFDKRLLKEVYLETLALKVTICVTTRPMISNLESHFADP